MNAEVEIVLRGVFDIIVFDDAGKVTERHTLGPNTDMTGFEEGTSAAKAFIDDAMSGSLNLADNTK